jgi:hypothetical protein
MDAIVIVQKKEGSAVSTIWTHYIHVGSCHIRVEEFRMTQKSFRRYVKLLAIGR